MAEGTSREGRLVAVCGIDGSGKATQTGLLAQRAEAEGLAVERLSFPRYGEGFFAELIERYLRGEFGPRAAEVNPYLAALPYALDRWQAAPCIRQWLGGGRLVLCNRYVPANMAHQGCKLPEGRRAEFFEWEERLEYRVFELPRPDLHLLLRMPPSRAGELIRGRAAREEGESQADIHEQDPSYLEETARVYERLARRQPERWACIDCTKEGRLLPPEEIAASVWKAVAATL